MAIESLPFGSYSSVFLGFVRGRERDALILSHACGGAFLVNRCGSVFPFSFFPFFISFLGCHTVRERDYSSRLKLEREGSHAHANKDYAIQVIILFFFFL